MLCILVLSLIFVGVCLCSLIEIVGMRIVLIFRRLVFCLRVTFILNIGSSMVGLYMGLIEIHYEGRINWLIVFRFGVCWVMKEM